MRTRGCAHVEIDDGHYDQRINMRLRGDVRAAPGQWERATLADHDRSAGIPIADIFANSRFQITPGNARTAHVRTLCATFVESGAVRVRPVIQQGRGIAATAAQAS